LPSKLKAEIGRELDRLELVKQQIAEVEAARDALLVAGDRSPGKLLLQLRSIDGSEIEPLVAGWSKVMVTVKPKFLEADSGHVATEPRRGAGARYCRQLRTFQAAPASKAGFPARFSRKPCFRVVPLPVVDEPGSTAQELPDDCAESCGVLYDHEM
jgi:hypothetical protein